MFLSTALILIILSKSVDAKWSKWGQHEYKVFRGRLKQYDAETECNGNGGHLASIHSKAENDFLSRLSYGHGVLWIGLYKDGNTWRWTDGTPANYFYWARGQPDFWLKEEFCVWAFESKPPGSWNDIYCGTKWITGYICKRKA